MGGVALAWLSFAKKTGMQIGIEITKRPGYGCVSILISALIITFTLVTLELSLKINRKN